MKKLWVMIAAAVLGLGVLTGCGPSQSQIEDGAKPLVDKILKDNLGDGAAKCLKVKITEKVDKNHYKATATLDNGNDINILIEHKDDIIIVTIPTNQ